LRTLPRALGVVIGTTPNVSGSWAISQAIQSLAQQAEERSRRDPMSNQPLGVLPITLVALPMTLVGIVIPPCAGVNTRTQDLQ
jgi:hypothetical protein